MQHHELQALEDDALQRRQQLQTARKEFIRMILEHLAPQATNESHYRALVQGLHGCKCLGDALPSIVVEIWSHEEHRRQLMQEQERQQEERKRQHEQRQGLKWVELILLAYRAMKIDEDKQRQQIEGVSLPLITGAYRGEPTSIITEVEHLESIIESYKQQRNELYNLLMRWAAYGADEQMYPSLAMELYYHGRGDKVPRADIVAMLERFIDYLDSAGDVLAVPVALQGLNYHTIRLLCD